MSLNEPASNRFCEKPLQVEPSHDEQTRMAIIEDDEESR